MNETTYCGVARRKVTPPLSLLPRLRGLMNCTYTEVLDDLFVRVLAVRIGKDTGLIITFDLDKAPCPAEFLAAITQETGIPEEHISFLGTHTHTAPIVGDRPNEGPNRLALKPIEAQEATHIYEGLLKQELMLAVREALDNLQPANIGWQTGESYVGVNRVQDYFVSNGDGSCRTVCNLGQSPAVPINRRLFVLKAETLDGAPIAFLVNHAVHNCVMILNKCASDGGTMISSDLGGNVSQWLEEAYPGSVALWTSGAAGDINPLLSAQIYYPDPITGNQAEYDLPERETAPLMMLKVLTARQFAEVQSVLRRVECKPWTGSVDGAVRWVQTPAQDKIARPDGTVEVRTGDSVDPYRVRVHYFRIGPLHMVGFGGELYSSIGSVLLEQMPECSILFNHDASMIEDSGYILDDATMARDTEGNLPGSRHTRMLPGYMQDALLSTVVSLLE
ncbi:MAG: hypothetical protein LUD82_07435 [Clostridiales bacterium]|nr:hypothetical protein [Clostridiales bacterium]